MKISAFTVLFELYLAKKKKRKKKKKEDEHIRNFVFGFSTLLRVSGSYRVDLALQ